MRDERLRDFRNFLYVIWKHLNLPDPTPTQYDIAEYLQHGPRRLILEAFRGVGKSWITSVYVLWLLYWNPALNILVVSASKSRADDFSTFTLRLINEVQFLNFLAPRGEQRNSKISFDVGPAPASHSPSVKSVGVTGMMSGSRADIIIADDVEVPNNSATQAMRDKLSEAVKEFDAILKPDGRVIYLGTPQCEMSLYNVLLTRGYQIRKWPARFPNKEQADRYGDTLAPRLVELMEKDASLIGKPTDPLRFDEFDLQEREASYGRSGFALQFMLDTSLSDADAYPLRLSDLVIMPLDRKYGPAKVVWGGGIEQELPVRELPNVGLDGDRWKAPMWVSKAEEPTEYTGSVLVVDPAGRGKDETAYAVVKILHGTLFLLDCGGFREGYTDRTLGKLAELARDYGVNMVLVESNMGDGMFTQLLKPYLRKLHPCSIEEVRHNTQKEKRIIDTLEPVMNQHRLVVNQSLITKDFRSTDHLPTEEALSYQLFYQMTRITRQRGALIRDDRLDAVAMAVAYWVEQMASDVDSQAKASEEAWLDQQVKEFIDHCSGGRLVGNPSWLDGPGRRSGSRLPL